jgi:hypothetical protein
LEETGQRVGERERERKRKRKIKRKREREREGEGRYGGSRSRYSYTRFVKLRGRESYKVDVSLSLKGSME